jgi:glycosyltransferase involved in cell wall biosynthesis
MRIAIDGRKIADYGIGTYIRGLLGGLAAHDADHEYLIFAPAAAADRIPDDPRFHRIEESSPHYSLRELLSLGRQLRRVSVDLFHAPHYVTPFTDTPMVVTVHDLIHLHQPLRNPLAKPYAGWMIARAVNRARRILTVSESVAGELAARWPEAAARTVVTPNGVDAIFRNPIAGADALLGARGLTRGGYFLFIGNDKPHKNLPRLVAAHRQLATDLPLVLAGSAFDALRQTPGPVVTGFLPQRELAALLGGALALLQPSLEEGFGLPAAEAMAAGVPVITSRAPALLEVTGDAALHADASSSEELASAMRRVAGDSALRALLIARGTQRAMSLTWERCAETTLTAYRDASHGR